MVQFQIDENRISKRALNYWVDLTAQIMHEDLKIKIVQNQPTVIFGVDGSLDSIEELQSQLRVAGIVGGRIYD